MADQKPPTAPTPPTPNALQRATDAFGRGDHSAASTAIYQWLLKSPDDGRALLLASEIEAARGNNDLAMETAASIPMDSAAGPQAVALRVKLLFATEAFSEAADVLLEAVGSGVKDPRLRHLAWDCLNRVGRRHEACEQADWLCRNGQATQPELLSLVSRAKSFPAPDMVPAETIAIFPDGLGKARWHFSRGDFKAGLNELDRQPDGGLDSKLLRGRLLAETQAWLEFETWLGSIDRKPLDSNSDAENRNDYWAAVGTYFHDTRQYEAAIHALLRAVQIDPTDRLSVQRLAGALAAVERTDDAEQFRFRGIEIYQCEREAETLFQSPNRADMKKLLATYSMELGRPFETLAWTLIQLPLPNALPPKMSRQAMAARQEIERQRKTLLNNPKAIQMRGQTAMLGLNPDQFDFDSAWNTLLAKRESTDRTQNANGPNSPSMTSNRGNSRSMATSPRLVNRAQEMGLDFQWYKDVDIDLSSIPIHESLGGGIAVLDFDLDGWSDLYLAQGSGDPPTDRATRSNQLLRHVGDRYAAVTGDAGAADTNYSCGLAAGDVNQDGFADLYLGAMGHNRLLINNGDGTFTDASDRLNTDQDRFTTSIAIADITGDALPDLYEANYIEMEGGFALPDKDDNGNWVPPTPLSHYADSDRWLENSSVGTFELHVISRDITKPGTALGVVITDIDGDGKNEVFVGNDVRPNHWLVQTGKRSFVNVADSLGLAYGYDGTANGCMGIATGDFNRDGRLDFQIANYSLESANLFLQTDSGAFIDQSRRYELSSSTFQNVGFGTKAIDLDRNGWLDFVVSNGHIFDMREQGEAYQMAPQVLMADDGRYQLTPVIDPSGYFAGEYLGRSVTQLDYDRDGAMDFVIGHLDQPYALIHNETHLAETADPASVANGWLQIELVGTFSERDAIGARVELRVGDATYAEWVTAGDGYLSSDEAVVGFEYPAKGSSIQLEVTWPSGKRQRLSGLTSDRRYLLIELDDTVWTR